MSNYVNSNGFLPFPVATILILYIRYIKILSGALQIILDSWMRKQPLIMMESLIKSSARSMYQRRTLKKEKNINTEMSANVG